MLNPVNKADSAFKSGPWYAGVISNVTRLDAFGPIIALEATVDTGRAVNAYKRGGKNEARERLIEDITGGIVWLFGVRTLNNLGDKILKKMYGGNFDVGKDLLRTPFENFIKNNSEKKFSATPKKVALIKGVKVLSSVVLADAFIGLVVPKLNQKLTRVLMAKDKAKEEKKKYQTEKAAELSKDVAFKGGGLAAINVFTNAIENTNIGKLLSTDAGLISGRIYSARNGNERREIAIRDIGSIYFYMFAAVHMSKLLNLIESGHASRLNPDSANIFDEYLVKFLEKHGNEMTVEEFKKYTLGKKSSEIALPEIEFETAKVSKLAKFFNKKKEPLQVVEVGKLKNIPADVMARIREMSKLQPLRQGEAIVTKQQIVDAYNMAEINNPELLGKIFDKYTKGAYKDQYKYVSNDKLYKLKAEMEMYINDMCKRAKDGKITKDMLTKFKNKNLILNGVNFAAGFAFAATFLSTLIPKFQYWVTRKKTGVDAFPGTYEYKEASKM